MYLMFNQIILIMKDIHDIIMFSVDGEKIFGVVIEHYTNPLDDYYVVYADYAIYKMTNTENDAQIIIDNVIIPACDQAINDYLVKKQHLKDIANFHNEIEAIKEAIKHKMDFGESFGKT